MPLTLLSLRGGTVCQESRTRPPAVRQPGYLLFDRPLGFAPPPRGGFALLAAPRRQHAASAPYSFLRGVYVLHATKSRPISENSVKRKLNFREYPFRNCL